MTHVHNMSNKWQTISYVVNLMIHICYLQAMHLKGLVITSYCCLLPKLVTIMFLLTSSFFWKPLNTECVVVNFVSCLFFMKEIWMNVWIWNKICLLLRCKCVGSTTTVSDISSWNDHESLKLYWCHFMIILKTIVTYCYINLVVFHVKLTCFMVLNLKTNNPCPVSIAMRIIRSRFILIEMLIIDRMWKMADTKYEMLQVK